MQVAAKHTCTLCGFKRRNTVNWCMVVLCKQNLAETAAVSCCSNQITLSIHHSVDIKKRAIKGNIHSFRITGDMSAVSLLESRK